MPDLPTYRPTHRCMEERLRPRLHRSLLAYQHEMKLRCLRLQPCEGAQALE